LQLQKLDDSCSWLLHILLLIWWRIPIGLTSLENYTSGNRITESSFSCKQHICTERERCYLLHCRAKTLVPKRWWNEEIDKRHVGWLVVADGTQWSTWRVQLRDRTDSFKPGA
jgi:hypothetical protein